MTGAAGLAALLEDRESPPKKPAADHAGLLASVPPLVPGDWLPIRPETATRMLEQLPAPLGPPGETALRARRLPFFPGWILLEAVERHRPASVRIRSALLGERELVTLDGEMGKVHKVRSACYAPGGAFGVMDYLRFFTTVCRAEKGRFHVVTEPADLSPGEKVADAAINIVRCALLDPVLTEETPDGWKIRTRVIYGPDLFDSEFLVPPDGACEMRGDTLLARGALSAVEDWDDNVLTLPIENRGVRHGR